MKLILIVILLVIFAPTVLFGVVRLGLKALWFGLIGFILLTLVLTLVQ